MPERSPLPPRLRTPLVVAIAGCVAILTLVALVPLAVDAPWSSLELYWTAGIGGLWGVGGLAVVLTIALLAVWTGRTAPDSGLGIALGVALILAVAAVIWAVSVDGDLVVELSPETWFGAHRWLTAASAIVPAVGIGWAASRIGLV